MAQHFGLGGPYKMAEIKIELSDIVTAAYQNDGLSNDDAKIFQRTIMQAQTKDDLEAIVAAMQQYGIIN
jgi:hypothetical protein